MLTRCAKYRWRTREGLESARPFADNIASQVYKKPWKKRILLSLREQRLTRRYYIASKTLFSSFDLV